LNSYLFPAFLKLDLFIWGVLIAVFILFTRYIQKSPSDSILKAKAKAIENKKRLGIKIYRI